MESKICAELTAVPSLDKSFQDVMESVSKTKYSPEYLEKANALVSNWKHEKHVASVPLGRSGSSSLPLQPQKADVLDPPPVVLNAPLSSPASSPPRHSDPGNFYCFPSDGTVAFCENPGAVDEQWSIPDATTLAALSSPRLDPRASCPSSPRLASQAEMRFEYGDLYAPPSVTAVQRSGVAGRSKDRAIEVLEGHLLAQELCAKEALRRADQRCEARVQALCDDYEARLAYERDLNLKLRLKLASGVDEARVRIGADARERALALRIRELEMEKQGLKAELRESRSLIENNWAAGAKQRAELAQLRAGFPVVKAELDQLKQSCLRKTEFADLQAKYDALLEKGQRALLSERVRFQRQKERLLQARAADKLREKAKVNAYVARVKEGFAQLDAEFYDRVGEDPVTQLNLEFEEEEPKGSVSDD